VGDHRGRRAELAVDPRDGLENDDPGGDVQRAGGLVAEQDVGAFGDGPGDGDSLLFAAGELRLDEQRPDV
jgi:hypothetical protein